MLAVALLELEYVFEAQYDLDRQMRSITLQALHPLVLQSLHVVFEVLTSIEQTQLVCWLLLHQAFADLLLELAHLCSLCQLQIDLRGPLCVGNLVVDLDVHLLLVLPALLFDGLSAANALKLCDVLAHQLDALRDSVLALVDGGGIHQVRVQLLNQVQEPVGLIFL